MAFAVRDCWTVTNQWFTQLARLEPLLVLLLFPTLHERCCSPLRSFRWPLASLPHLEAPPPPPPSSLFPSSLPPLFAAEQWASAEWCRGRRTRAGKRHYGMGGSVLAAHSSGGRHSDRRMPSWTTRVHPHEGPSSDTLQPESAASEGFGHCGGLPLRSAGGRGLVVVGRCCLFFFTF